MAETLGVAEAKRRFSELIDRVRKGERFVIARHGKPAVALVPPQGLSLEPEAQPTGLASIAGAFADWTELDTVVEEIYRARRGSRDRPVPEL